MKLTLQQTVVAGVNGALTFLGRWASLASRLRSVAALWSALTPRAGALRQRVGAAGGGVAYTTPWLDLTFDIADARGERVVLTRRQRVRLLRPGHVTVRELVWGEGDPLVRYQARGAQRVGERFEGSKRAVLLDLDASSPAGSCVTITSRRTMRGAFLAAEEYVEAFLERPTSRLSITVRFPATRPPRRARLVAATTEHVLRLVPLRYDAAGRPVLRCRIRQPAIGVTYSMRWSW